MNLHILYIIELSITKCASHDRLKRCPTRLTYFYAERAADFIIRGLNNFDTQGLRRRGSYATSCRFCRSTFTVAPSRPLNRPTSTAAIATALIVGTATFFTSISHLLLPFCCSVIIDPSLHDAGLRRGAERQTGDSLSRVPGIYPQLMQFFRALARFRSHDREGQHQSKRLPCDVWCISDIAARLWSALHSAYGFH